MWSREKDRSYKEPITLISLRSDRVMSFHPFSQRQQDFLTDFRTTAADHVTNLQVRSSYFSHGDSDCAHLCEGGVVMKYAMFSTAVAILSIAGELVSRSSKVRD